VDDIEAVAHEEKRAKVQGAIDKARRIAVAARERISALEPIPLPSSAAPPASYNVEKLRAEAVEQVVAMRKEFRGETSLRFTQEQRSTIVLGPTTPAAVVAATREGRAIEMDTREALEVSYGAVSSFSRQTELSTQAAPGMREAATYELDAGKGSTSIIAILEQMGAVRPKSRRRASPAANGGDAARTLLATQSPPLPVRPDA
jgi:hypothetical protein